MTPFSNMNRPVHAQDVATVFNAPTDERSAFEGLFRNHWLWAGTAMSAHLLVAVVAVPFLQNAFSTVGLSVRDWRGVSRRRIRCYG